MNRYRYDSKTLEYLHPVPCQPNPARPGEFAIPPNTSASEPPATADGEVAVLDRETDQWAIKDDHRGETVWSITDKQSMKVEALGPIPETHTPHEPGKFDQWDGAQWITDTAAEQQHHCDLCLEALKQQRKYNRQTGFTHQGFVMEATEIDQANILTIITSYSEGIIPADTPVQWKAAPNQYLTLAGKPDAIALGAAMNAYVQQLFNIEATLAARVASMTTEELKSFNAEQKFQEEIEKL